MNTKKRAALLTSYNHFGTTFLLFYTCMPSTNAWLTVPFPCASSNLADNWSIDIASELEEYLHELESITFSFDGIGKSLNFAEGSRPFPHAAFRPDPTHLRTLPSPAALLIQGSTIIYSKKVEHLYTLLYQTIDFLREQKKKVHKRDDAGGHHGEEDGGAADDDEDEFREQEAEFLTLDDMKESENIDLDESGGTIPIASH